MKIIILYRPASDHSRVVDEYVREFVYRNPEVKLEVLSIDTKEGWDLGGVYDVMQYPSMLAIRDDGSLAHSWVGEPLPLMNEVAYYTVV